MKKIVLLLICGSALFTGCNKSSNTEKVVEKTPTAVEEKDQPVTIQKQHDPDTLKGSLKAQATGSIGNVEIKISYHSPAVRGRIVWGGLVPYDQVWVTGAHMATSVTFNQDILIGEKTIPAGKYGFFTIPGKDEWTIIINTNWEQHLTDKYDSKDDLVRVMVKPNVVEMNQERLQYTVESDSNTEGEIVVYWERLEISLPIKVNG